MISPLIKFLILFSSFAVLYSIFLSNSSSCRPVFPFFSLYPLVSYFLFPYPFQSYSILITLKAHPNPNISKIESFIIQSNLILSTVQSVQSHGIPLNAIQSRPSRPILSYPTNRILTIFHLDYSTRFNSI